MDLLPFLTREPTLFEKIYAAASYPFNLLTHPLQSLLSLPLLSFLVIPAFSSYSTTLNFLFFYMTWAILIRSNPPLQVELLGTLAIRFLFYLLPSALFLGFDSVFSELAKGLKEQGDDALAMSEAHGGVKGKWWRVVLVSVVNVVLSTLLQTGVDFVFTRVLRIRSALKITTTLPLPWIILKDVLLGLLLREILTYALHRFVLHGQRSRLTRYHKRWQHSVVSPYSFVAHYDHPVTYLIHVFLPMYLPAVFLRMHLLTYHIYLIVVSLEETFAYSGYNVLPTAFILGGIARRQERHLMGGGKGNFGCLGLADFVLSTSLGEDLAEDVIEEVDDKQIAKKAKRKSKATKKRPTRSRKTSDEEDEEASEQAVEEISDNGNDDGDSGEEGPRRKSRGQSNGRNSKKTNERAKSINGGERPNRKSSNAGKKAKGRPKRRSDEDD